MLLPGLQGCSNVNVKDNQGFNLVDRSHLYDLKAWSFRGRLAVKSKVDSWSAAISWQHQPEQDILKLTGPLGQGAVLMTMTAQGLKIDQGDGRVEFSKNPDQLLADRLGMFVPLSALKFWVVGLVQPGVEFKVTDSGFEQSGWSINYPLYMQVERELMPHKMRVYKDQLQLKLVFDQWQ